MENGKELLMQDVQSSITVYIFTDTYMCRELCPARTGRCWESFYNLVSSNDRVLCVL